MRAEQVDTDGFTDLRELDGPKFTEGIRVAQCGGIQFKIDSRGLAKLTRHSYGPQPRNSFKMR